MKRRTFLQALAAAPLACARAPTQRALPDGELLSPGMAMGHRLRGTAHVDVPADAWTDAPIVVVGAGAAGLACAWRLRRAGVPAPLVLELDDVVGGTARSGRSDVTAYPWGAHYITAPLRENRALTALLHEMGCLDGVDDDGDPVPAEHVAVRDPEERLFQHGQFFEGLFPADAASPTDLAQWRAFQARVDALASWRDDRGRRAFASPLARSSTDPRLTALDRQSMESWLDLKGFTSPRVRWAVEYACRDDYGATLSTTSAWAALFYFASRRRAAGARERPVLTWPAGNAPLLARLSTGVVPVCGRAVADLELVRGGVVVRGLDASGRAFGVRAQHVVVAAPRFVAARLLAHEREQPPAYLERCTTSPWLVVNLHLSQHPRSWGFPRAWDNVLHESPSLGYVTATHQSGRDRGPTVLTWYQPFVDADTRQARARLLATTREDAVRLALDDLAVCHRDLADVVTRADACRFGHGMVRPVPGLIHSNARLQAAAPVVVESMPRVFFAHTDLSGLALFEEAFFHGVRAAEELLRARNVTSEALL